MQNKTLIKINYSYLLITLGLVQINDTVVSTYERHSMLVASQTKLFIGSTVDPCRFMSNHCVV